MSRRLLIAIVVFAAVSALALLVPRALPGEMPAGDSARHPAPACATCPPTEQIVAAGMAPGDHGWFVNVWFAAPPVNARVVMTFDGVAGAISLQQQGKAWADTHAKNAPARLTSVGQRDTLVVFELPASLAARGVAIATGGGDRLPASGFVAPVYQPATAFNATDVVLLAILLATAAAGYTRGALSGVADLVVMVASVAIAAVAVKPLAAWLSEVTLYPRGAAALASGVVVLVVATAGLALVPRLTAGMRATTNGMAPAVNGGVGALTAGLRQLPVLAMILAIGNDVAVLHWASSSINTSVLGSALIRAWQTIF